MSDTRKKLDENIPENVISSRQGGGGKSLSYLETWYVIDRLNQVLGQGNWGYNSKVTKVHEGVVNNTNTVHYIAEVTLYATIDNKTTHITDYGYGDGQDKFNPGKAHELAVKESVSDGLKRCAKNLGRSMGLALYDKTQEYVGEVNATPETTKNSGRVGLNPVPRDSGPKQGITGSVQSAERNKTTTVSGRPDKSQDNQSVGVSRKSRDTIAASFSVLQGQKKITTEEFKVKILKGKKLSELTETEVSSVLADISKSYPELKLGSN